MKYTRHAFFVAKEVEMPDIYVHALYLSRDSEFGQALERTGIKEKLRSDLTLNEIIDEL